MKRFQNRVALSRFSLALASLFGALVWLAAGLISRNMWIPFLLMALSTYLMAEINNRNALIRVRTNMVSSAFLLLSLMGIGQNFGAEEAFVQLCFVGFLLAIFHTYQNKFAVAYIFYAFLLISISSLAFVQMLWFVPLLACLLSRPLYALSWKGISAVVLATVLPYWIVAPYLVYMGDIEPLIDHFDDLIDTESIFDYSHITVGMLTEYVILVIFAGIGWIHFIRTSHKDVPQCFCGDFHYSDDSDSRRSTVCRKPVASADSQRKSACGAFYHAYRDAIVKYHVHHNAYIGDFCDYNRSVNLLASDAIRA